MLRRPTVHRELYPRESLVRGDLSILIKDCYFTVSHAYRVAKRDVFLPLSLSRRHNILTRTPTRVQIKMTRVCIHNAYDIMLFARGVLFVYIIDYLLFIRPDFLFMKLGNRNKRRKQTMK